MTNKNKDEFIDKISELTLTTSDKKDMLDESILFEDVTKRSEKAKHFKTKDGEYVAAIYDEPIHMFDETTGKYIEFADSLKENDDCYELTAGKFKARFPKEDDDSHFVEIERNRKCIGWHIQSNSARRNKASVFKKERKNKTSRREFPHFKYENGENNIALEYDVTDDGVKENIILNSRPVDNSFKFDLKLNGLLAVLSGDKKTVTIYDEDTDAVPDFILPKINMTDAAGVYSEDAHYEITKEKGNTTLEIVVSPEWLYAEERVYPITIDPQVMVYYAPKGANSVTTVKSNGAKVTSGSTRTVGYDENGTESRTFMKFNFPDLPDGAKPISAQVNLFQAQFTGSIEYNVCKITEDWNSSTISWSNQPNYNCACLCDTFESKASGSSHTVILDVSAPVLNCYRNGTTDYGLAIVPAEGSCVLCQNGNATVFEEEFIEFDSAPIAFVKYMLVDDYVSYQKTESFESGRAGTGTVNLFTGKLNFVHNDIVEPDGNLPFTLSHIYRSELTTTSDDNTFGKGWRLSALQTIESTMINTTLDTVYIDSLGRRHYFTDFYRDASGNEIYYDTAGLGLMYSQYKNEITDEKGNKLTFENGKLKKIITAYGEYVNTYNAAGQLLTVTNSVGKNINLSYNSAGRLSTIKDANDICTSYFYDSYGNLTQITYHDGSKTKYSYDSASRLIKVTNQDINEYVISYETSGNDRRVTGITEKGKNSAEVMVSGGGIDIEYQAFSAVVQNKITKMRTVYRFDDIGRMRYSYEDTSLTNLAKDGITATDLREYEVLCNSQGTETAGRYASVKAAITGTSGMHDNYLTNGSFDSSTAGNALPAYWIMGADYTGTDGVITTDGYASGYNSFKFNNTCCRSKKSIQQSVNMRNEDINGNMLVASAWAKASNPVNTHGDSDDTNAKFELYAKVTYADVTELSRTEMFDYGCTDWQYVAIPLEIPDHSNKPAVVTVKFNFSGNTGTCLLSNVRLTSTYGLYTKIDYDYTETYIEQFFENSYEETVVKCVEKNDGIKKEYTFYNALSDAVKTSVLSDGEWFNSFVRYSSHKPIEAKDYRGLITKYTYDSHGNLIHQKTHPIHNHWDAKFESCSKDEYGKVIKSYDPRTDNYYTEYEYDSKCGMLVKEIDANQQIYSHMYDSNKRQTSFTAVNANGSSTNIANDTTYNNDRVSSLGHNTTSYSYTYDPFGRTSAITIAGSTLLSLTYVDLTTSSVTSNYNNGNSVEIISDARGNPTSKIINDTIVSVAKYDAHGHIIELLDNRENVCYKYKYEYDLKGNLIKVEETNDSTLVNRLSYTYDAENRLHSRIESSTGFTYNTLYDKCSSDENEHIYPDNTVVGTELVGKYKDTATFSTIRQPYMHKLTLSDTEDPFIVERNDYITSTRAYCTDFISEVEQTVGGNTYTTQYTYDEMGNIASYSIGGNTVSYGYDKLGRLTRETNGITGYSTYYYYDNGGNITSKEIFNAGDLPHETYTYTYDTVWKDKLLSITKTDVETNTTTTETITYDDSVNILGNPKTYRGNNLTWTDVRRLASYGSNTFSYGADGIRFKKNNITYTLDGSRILKESGARNITYYYGLSGVIGFNYEGFDYYYRKNIQGDVIAIHDSNGTLVASYAYDAWGKCTILSGGDSTDSIANINPFRYRSYYYDTETGLYYLETRYYDPEIGRFINADSIEYLDPETIGGLNLFAYCNNNPVMGYDPTGQDWNRIGKAVMIVSVVAAAIAISVATYGAGSGMALVLSAAAIGAGAELFDQAVIENKELNEVNWGKVCIAGLAEGVAAAYCPFSIWRNALVSAGVSFLGNNLIGETESIGDLLYDITAGCIGGYALDFLGKRLSKLPKKVFGIEYTNYSTYQRALRENGYMFPRAEVKQMMHNARTFRSIRNDIVNNTAAFSSGIFWVLLKMKLN